MTKKTITIKQTPGPAVVSPKPAPKPQETPLPTAEALKQINKLGAELFDALDELNVNLEEPDNPIRKWQAYGLGAEDILVTHKFEIHYGKPGQEPIRMQGMQTFNGMLKSKNMPTAMDQFQIYVSNIVGRALLSEFQDRLQALIERAAPPDQLQLTRKQEKPEFTFVSNEREKDQSTTTTQPDPPEDPAD